MDERREVLRIKKSLVLQYSIFGDKTSSEKEISHIKDIGEKGVCITTHTYIPVNTKMSLIFTLPFKPFNNIEVIGKVVHEDELKTRFDVPVAGTFITHLKFVEIKEEDRESIAEYVDWFCRVRIKPKEK